VVTAETAGAAQPCHVREVPITSQMLAKPASSEAGVQKSVPDQPPASGRALQRVCGNYHRQAVETPGSDDGSA
jgi:hypothetical protein